MTPRAHRGSMHQQMDDDGEIRSWYQFLFKTGMSWGMPSLLLLLVFGGIGWFVCYVTPRLLQSMDRFIDSTIYTQERITETQKEIAESQQVLAQSQKSMTELVSDVKRLVSDVSVNTQATIAFTEEVKADHTKMKDTETEILSGVERIEKAVGKE